MQSRTRAFMRDQILDVLLGAAEHRLDHHAAVGPEAVEQPPAEELERALGVVRALHVEPDEAVERRRLLEDRDHVGDAELLGDVEPHLGQLDRDVHLDAARGHPVEHAEVLIAGGDGLGLDGDALAQQVERGGDAPAASSRAAVDALLDRLAGHEARREPPREAVAAHEVEDALPLGEPEQALSHDHDGILSGAGTAADGRPKIAPEASRGGQRSVEGAQARESLCNPVTGVTLRDRAGSSVERVSRGGGDRHSADTRSHAAHCSAFARDGPTRQPRRRMRARNAETRRAAPSDPHRVGPGRGACAT